MEDGQADRDKVAGADGEASAATLARLVARLGQECPWTKAQTCQDMLFYTRKWKVQPPPPSTANRESSGESRAWQRAVACPPSAVCARRLERNVASDFVRGAGAAYCIRSDQITSIARNSRQSTEGGWKTRPFPSLPPEGSPAISY